MRIRVAPGLHKSFAYRNFLALLFLLPGLFPSRSCVAQTTAVRYRESPNRGFLVVRDQSGKTIGSGELIQLAYRDRISARLILRFKDGSLDDETTEFSQDRTIKLIGYRHIQRGPSFPHPIDASIDMAAQQVKVVSLDKADGGPPRNEHMDLPQDLSNGLVLNLLKNLQSDAKQLEFPYVAFSPKARLVKLAVSKIDQQSFRVGGRSFRADHYTLTPKIVGIAGVIAPLVGKQPANIEVWLASGKVPALVRADSALYDGGPILSIQLASPSW